MASPMRPARRHLLPWVLLLALAPTAGHAAACVDFLGAAVMPQGQTVEGTPVGGLSALAFDPTRDRFLAVSDDRAEHGPARFYSLTALIEPGGLRNVAFDGVTRLRQADGTLFPPGSIDAEGMARLPDGRLVVSSEGDLANHALPFIGLFDADGTLRQQLPLPRGFMPAANGAQGVRDNLSFEGVTLFPDGHTLAVSLENALIQDGPRTSPTTESPARIVLFDLRTGQPGQQYVYIVGRVPVTPPDPAQPGDNGISDILALNATTLLVMERGYTPHVGNTIRLYRADLKGATDVAPMASLKEGAFAPVQKTLLFDLGKEGVPLDNVEGVTFGPPLPDGRRTLLLVSDDNFNPHQRTIFYGFALTCD